MNLQQQACAPLIDEVNMHIFCTILHNFYCTDKKNLFNDQGVFDCGSCTSLYEFDLTVLPSDVI